MREPLKQIAMILRGCLPWVTAAVLLAFAAPGTAWAEHVLDRINNTGVFNAGTRTDALPFAYRDKKGQLVGFSVDLLREIHKRLKQRFNRPIEMKLVPTTASDRMEMVANAAIDIQCGIATPTWEREVPVDFSIPFFGNGTRIMTLRDTAMRLEDLRGKRIGVAVGTTTAGILTEQVPDAVIVDVPDMDVGFALFERGEIDGLSNIGIVLRAKVEKARSRARSSCCHEPRRYPTNRWPASCLRTTPNGATSSTTRSWNFLTGSTNSGDPTSRFTSAGSDRAGSSISPWTMPWPSDWPPPSSGSSRVAP